MLSFLLWMIAEFDNTSSEVQRDQQPENWSKLAFLFRVLLPVAGLVILFKQKHIFSRLLLQLDRNCVSVFCPSFSRREKLLKWAGSRLPETWSSQSRTLAGGVAELWSDGSLLCTLINSAIPGACLNPHRHWKKPPLHAQAIAYKYLGVIPIFTENDLNSTLTISLERNFLHYLNELQQAIIRQSEKTDTPKSISMHYIARGMGLYSGEQHRKTVFYVYANKNTTGQNSNIIVHIRGPYATYGKAVIPKFHTDLFAIPEINITTDVLTTKKLLNGKVVKPRNSFMKNFSLPFMQYHKKHMGDNIVIDVTMEDERAKVTYIPKNYGMYEIIMVSNGEQIRGCPFNVHILNNTSGIEDTLDGEEKVDDIPALRKRKVLSKTIDFIDEQMPIADMLRRYKSNEENWDLDRHIECRINKEEIKTNIKQDREDVKDSLDERTELPNEIFCLSRNGDEIYKKKEDLLHDTIFGSTDKSELNYLEDEMPIQKDDGVLEKQNSESTTEHSISKLHVTNENNLIVDHILNENNQTQGIIHKVNNYTDNKSTRKVVNNHVSVGLQIKSVADSANEDKKAVDALDKNKQAYNVTCDIIPQPCPSKVEVNKVKIPEKFCENENIANINFGNGLHTKYFKNVINTSSKRDIPKSTLTGCFKSDIECDQTIKNYLEDTDYSFTEITQNFKKDHNNNSIPRVNHNERKQTLVNGVNQRYSKVDVGKQKVVPRRFVQNQEHLQNEKLSLNNSTNTSPICLDHIVPEVDNDYMKMSVAERRKIFARKVQEKTTTSTNSSFSESENGEGSPSSGRFRQFEGLSVLNYLGSLKKSESSSNREPYTLCSTMSLPNISSIESDPFPYSVKERKNFWEKMSSSSSSLSINSATPLKGKPKKLTEAERCRLIWKKPNETKSNININTMGENSELETNSEISKSADDISSITNFIQHSIPKKYKSMDNALDKCTMMSIEERKRVLLKQNYEKEKPKKQCYGFLKHDGIKEKCRKVVIGIPVEKNEDQNADIAMFSSISERIKKYHSACNLSNKKVEEEKLKAPSNSTTTDSGTTTVSKNGSKADLQETPQPEIKTVKSHFRRAIKYFKNLEEKSLNKSEARLNLKDCRRHSLDVPLNHRKGGSLNLPNVKQRFSLNNLYVDVFGERRGSFKGAANRSALVEALATFSRRENHSFRNDEDNIMYEMFQRKAKTKKRRSIRSIFDIYY